MRSAFSVDGPFVPAAVGALKAGQEVEPVGGTRIVELERRSGPAGPLRIDSYWIVL